MTEEVTTPPREKDRWKSAAFVFLALGFIKIFLAFKYLGAAGNAATPNHSSWVFGSVVATVEAIVAFAVTRGLLKHAPWAARIGTWFSVLQMALILLVYWIGPIAIVYMILGLMALTNIHLAEAFEKYPDPKA